MSWFHQVHNFGLGNMINCTPALRWLADSMGKPVPCFFDLEWVAECFKDCPFIEILESKPHSSPLFTSVLTNTTHNVRPDYQFIFEAVSKQKWNGQRCYIDAPQPTVKGGYFVMVAGSGNECEKYLNTKRVEASFYQDVIEASMLKPVFVGSEKDLRRNPWAQDYATDIGDVRAALALINGAAFVVGNDTGLIHAAGAMNKPTFVFWKDTQRPRCENSGEFSQYFMQDDWGRVSQMIPL